MNKLEELIKQNNADTSEIVGWIRHAKFGTNFVTALMVWVGKILVAFLSIYAAWVFWRTGKMPPFANNGD